MKGTKIMDKKSSSEVLQGEKEKAKPSIPRDVLISWLENKIKMSGIKNVSIFRAGFLWEHGDIERYRINVWVREQLEDQYCDRIYIAYSWFVHYHRRTKIIVDKTIVKDETDVASKKYYY